MGVYALKKPIYVTDKLTVTEVHYRDELVAGDYVAGGNIDVIASLSGLDAAIVGRMAGRDYLNMVAIVDDLFSVELKASGLLPADAGAVEMKAEHEKK